MFLNLIRKFNRYLHYKSICNVQLFNREYYEKECGIAGVTINHYMEIGWKKGYDPSKEFSTNRYMKAYPDVAKSGMNPLLHYYLHGAKEGRTAGLSSSFSEVLRDMPNQHHQPIQYAWLLLKTRYSGLYNAAWYMQQYGVQKDAFRHYIEEGYKQGFNPSADFSTSEYIAHYPQVGNAKVNPLLHYIHVGKKSGYFYGVEPVERIRKSQYFNNEWYRKAYHIPEEVDAVQHYMTTGWKLWYHPSAEFSGIRYFFDRYELLRDEKQFNPLMHYELTGNRISHLFPQEPIEPGLTKADLMKYKAIQDEKIQKQYPSDTKKLIVYLVPERDAIGGGVMSICSIAKVTASIEETMDYKVMVATVPSVNTFPKYTKFKNDVDIFRFEQIPEYFTSLEEVIFHIPEIFTIPFMVKLKPMHWVWMQHLPKVQINILNQNMDFVPRPSVMDILKQNISDVTMTCAHRQYATPQMRTSYDMPVHLLSASNLVKYQYVPYEKKKNLLLYSPDEADFKPFVLQKIRQEFPQLEMREIRNISYNNYLKLITEAKWMITFGEGIDGYFAESLRCGAIPFAVQNPTFFSEAFENLENVYTSYNDMLLHITDDIKQLSKASRYTALNDKLRQIDAQEYDDSEYKENIRKYYRGEYTFPIESLREERRARFSEAPLISICMATYNGAEYLLAQLNSIAALTYPNIELIVSDDGSKDDTLKILHSFKPNFPYKVLKNTGRHGLVENFSNAIVNARGDYIALADQDDIWNPNKLEVLLERIDGFDIVHGSVLVVDDQGVSHPMECMHAAYEMNKTTLYRPINYLEENPILGCTCLMRADFVHNAFPSPKGFVYHDWWLALKAICEGQGVCYVDIPVIKYRQHDANTAKTTFNSKDWAMKKLLTLQLIERTFEKHMKRYEVDMLQSGINSLCLAQFSQKYAPAYVDEYFGANRRAMTNQTLQILRTTIDAVLKGEQDVLRKN